MILVLYSATKGWWKIADFGITSDGETSQLKSTAAGRGTYGYRAPELLQEHMRFSKEADVWSLGCILYELCTSTRAFVNDFAVREFESPEKLSIKFVDGLGEKFKNTVQGQWINQMLQRDYGKRPTVEFLATQFSGLVSSVIPKATVNVSISEMLGTDGPLPSSIPPWEEIFVPGSFQKQSALFDRYHRIFVTRSMLLGVEHPSLLWSALRLVWACMYRDEFA